MKKVQSTSAGILDMGHERKQGIKDDDQRFSLTSGRMELIPTGTEKAEEGVRSGERTMIGLFFKYEERIVHDTAK